MKRVRDMNELAKLAGDRYVETEKGEKVRIVREVVREIATTPPPKMASMDITSLTSLISDVLQSSEARTNAMLKHHDRVVDELAQAVQQKPVPAQPDTKQPHGWVFTIQRDEIGRLQQITATPTPP